MLVLNGHIMAFGFHSECDGKPLKYLVRKGKGDTGRLMYQFLKAAIQITTNLVPQNNRIYSHTVLEAKIPKSTCWHVQYDLFLFWWLLALHGLWPYHSHFYHCLRIAFFSVSVSSPLLSL